MIYYFDEIKRSNSIASDNVQLPRITLHRAPYVERYTYYYYIECNIVEIK